LVSVIILKRNQEKDQADTLSLIQNVFPQGIKRGVKVDENK